MSIFNSVRVHIMNLILQARGPNDIQALIQCSRAFEDFLRTYKLHERMGISQDEEIPESHYWDIKLWNDGGNKIQCIKVVREITGLGLKEAKDLVDSVATTRDGVCLGMARYNEVCREFQDKFNSIGVSSEIVPV